MLQALEPVFDASDFGFQQIAEIVKTLVHGITEIVDTTVLEKDSQQVAANDNSEGSPLVDNRVHLA